MKYKVLKDFVDRSGNILNKGDIYEVVSCLSPDLLLDGLVEHGFIEKDNDGPWEPKDGEGYCYLNDTGYTRYEPHFCYDTEDDDRLDIGNCFQTVEQAEKAVQWLKAFKVLRDDTKGFKPDWNDGGQRKWQVYFDTFYDDDKPKELRVGDEVFYHNSILYFATLKDAEESIKKHKKEWYQFLEIEEEE